MKIGIIVYSNTGHTLSVARQLEQALSAAGHKVELEQVLTEGTPKPGATHVPLKTRPWCSARRCGAGCRPRP
jgi:flavodoxin